MSDWVDFNQWSRCAEMQRPGYVFEMVNDEGLRLLTPCVERLELPFDWQSPPVRFRLVKEQEPRHSAPIPKPRRP